MVAFADVPSPQMIRVVDDFGSVSPNIVGLMPRPAPESMMTSPSALHNEVSRAEILMSTSPGSKGKPVASVLIIVGSSVVVVGGMSDIDLEPTLKEFKNPRR